MKNGAGLLRQDDPARPVSDVVIDRTNAPKATTLVCVFRVQDDERLTRVEVALVASEDAAARQSDQATLVALGAQLFRLRQLHDFLLLVGVENETLTLRAAIAGKDRQHVHEDQTLPPTLGALLVDHRVILPPPQ